jgi:hypothetical protein
MNRLFCQASSSPGFSSALSLPRLIDTKGAGDGDQSPNKQIGWLPRGGGVYWAKKLYSVEDNPKMCALQNLSSNGFIGILAPLLRRQIHNSKAFSVGCWGGGVLGGGGVVWGGG